MALELGELKSEFLLMRSILPSICMASDRMHFAKSLADSLVYRALDGSVPLRVIFSATPLLNFISACVGLATN
jgi:hypothetical protein